MQFSLLEALFESFRLCLKARSDEADGYFFGLVEALEVLLLVDLRDGRLSLRLNFLRCIPWHFDARLSFFVGHLQEVKDSEVRPGCLDNRIDICDSLCDLIFIHRTI